MPRNNLAVVRSMPTVTDIVRQFHNGQSDRMILGDGCIFSTDTNITGLNNNKLVYGGSGSGKTASILAPEMLEAWHKSMICVVTKRNLAEMHMADFHRKGYRVYDLNFANPMHGNVAYDPIRFMSTEEDILDFAKSVVSANKDPNQNRYDPFWENSGTSLLAAFISLAKERRGTIYKNFTTILEDLSRIHISSGDGNNIVTNYDEVFNKLESENPNSFAVKCWKTFREGAESTARSVYVTMNASVDKLFTSSICNSIRMLPKLDVRSLMSQKSVIFVTTSPVNKTLHSLANIFMGQAIKTLFEWAEAQPDGTLPIPFHVSFDDFATGCRINNFPEHISIFREKGISCTLLLQSMDQLYAMYGEHNAHTIMDNCDTIVYMGSNNMKTANEFSRRLNRPLEDVLYMPVGQEYVFRRGSHPIATKRYPIFEDERFQRIQADYQRRISCRGNAR